MHYIQIGPIKHNHTKRSILVTVSAIPVIFHLISLCNQNNYIKRNIASFPQLISQ